MRKKIGIRIAIITSIIILIAVILFCVDYVRAKQQNPIFCIPDLAREMNKEETMEYFGLGYKGIAFHRFDEDNAIKIDSWFIQQMS